MERWVAGLEANFGMSHDVRVARFILPASRILSLFQRYIGYARNAKVVQGSLNIVVSEANAFLLSTLDPLRTVVICHDLHRLEDPTIPAISRFLYKSNLAYLKRAYYIVAISQATKAAIRHHLPWIDSSRIKVVHNGIEPRFRQTLQPSEREEMRSRLYKSSKWLLLHVGNDNWYKNFSAVIDCLALLPNDFSLIKVGPIGPANKLRIENLKLADRIVHLPNVEDDELITIYNVANALVFPSLSEGFGWPLLEALACGCPAIVSDRGSLPEVGGDACVYVANPDGKHLASAIIGLLSDQPRVQKLTRKGVLQAQSFSWRKTCEELLRMATSVESS